MTTLGWVALGAGAWYLYQQNAVKLTANKQATSVVTHAGNAVNNLIDSGSSALGKFLSGLGSGGGGSSSGSSGVGSSYVPSYNLASDSDPSVYIPEYDYGD